VTDIAYWQTATVLWASMSAWLLVIGLIVSVFATAAGLIDFIGELRSPRFTLSLTLQRSALQSSSSGRTVNRR
jgi:uncharacterized membrane protein